MSSRLLLPALAAHKLSMPQAMIRANCKQGWIAHWKRKEWLVDANSGAQVEARDVDLSCERTKIGRKLHLLRWGQVCTSGQVLTQHVPVLCLSSQAQRQVRSRLLHSSECGACATQSTAALNTARFQMQMSQPCAACGAALMLTAADWRLYHSCIACT